MAQKIITASASSSSSSPVTGKRCPACRNSRKKRDGCNRCLGKGLVPLCSECGGGGMLQAEGAPKGFAVCGHCGGVGIEPRVVSIDGNSASRRHSATSSAATRGAGIDPQLKARVNPPREIREKAGRAAQRLKSMELDFG